MGEGKEGVGVMTENPTKTKVMNRKRKLKRKKREKKEISRGFHPGLRCSSPHVRDVPRATPMITGTLSPLLTTPSPLPLSFIPHSSPPLHSSHPSTASPITPSQTPGVQKKRGGRMRGRQAKMKTTDHRPPSLQSHMTQRWSHMINHVTSQLLTGLAQRNKSPFVFILHVFSSLMLLAWQLCL